MNFLFCFLLFAQAGFLQMQSSQNLKFENADSGLILKGQYIIDNQGDETAKNVFPVLQVDNFKWTGEPRDIDPGEKFAWSLSEEIPNSLLKGPSKGLFLISVQKYYQDYNGYQFQIPDLFQIAHNSENASSVNLAILVQSESSEKFDVGYEIGNPNAEDLEIHLTSYLPGEVEMTSELKPVQVPAQSQLLGNFEFRNKSALPGSKYVALLGAEWKNSTERFSQFAFASFEIPASVAGGQGQYLKETDRQFLSWWMWAMSFGLILMWIFWVRPLSKFQK